MTGNRTAVKTKYGFSLMEMLVVVTIIGILSVAAVPVAEITFVSLKESQLQDNLATIRAAIQNWRKDCEAAVEKQSGAAEALFMPDPPMYPPSLFDLASPSASGYIIKNSAGTTVATFYPQPYLHTIPPDPFVGESVWVQYYADGSSPELYRPGASLISTGVFDIGPATDTTLRRGFVTAIDGTKYSDW